MSEPLIVNHYRCPCGHIVDNSTSYLHNTDIMSVFSEDTKHFITGVNGYNNPLGLAACPNCSHIIYENIDGLCSVSFCVAKKIKTTFEEKEVLDDSCGSVQQD